MTEDRKQRTPTSRTWPCVFPQPAGDLVDQQVDKMWKSAFRASRTPFGDLRNQFRRQHCRTLNPYGSDTCPYAPDVCAAAFADAVRVTCDARPRVPVGYFRKVAKTIAAIRADSKPLARDRITVLNADQAGGTTSGMDQRPGTVPGTTTGPVSLGDLFRSLGVQPRQGQQPTDAGEEGTE